LPYFYFLHFRPPNANMVTIPMAISLISYTSKG
jgi:hypothetical protein